jgi:hypothetical protein
MDIGDELTPNFVDSGSEAESFLLSTSGISVAPDLRAFVEAQITQNTKGGPGSTLQSFQPLVAPRFNPGKWNNFPKICHDNNCYNYANNKITDTFAQPGRGSGAALPSVPNCKGTAMAAISDGQKPVTPNFEPEEPCPAGQWIALVIWPGQDYHWYRCDSSGMWSHKPGPTPARNTDNRGRPIADPRTCARGYYTVFCGFYQCIPDKTRIR